jgi:hypothetical protein
MSIQRPVDRSIHQDQSVHHRNLAMMTIPGKACPRSPAALVALLAVGILMAGCCGPRGAYPQPGFAGVPQAIHRSADFPLPLSDAARSELVQFIAGSGNRAVVEDDPPRPGRLRQAEADYGPILDRLQRAAPARADLREGTAFAALFDTNYLPLVVHDARAGWDGHDFYDPGTDDIRAFVKGDYVFAFYTRPVVPATNASDALRPNAWSLVAPTGGMVSAYHGLVVFSKNFAIPTLAR